ncbi:nitrilase 4 [Kockovaella imperatae]|uniref:Nitrilase 4 n=1 Tax=Kockovaella imperatae TaxID=4999 RepID=A0A1Y1UL39_9TREE|nr:nitrilase 4 [Kockovaella imperatae]ORX38702.1 nitrilase 4 [Kockovaella imperatae]
MAPITVAAVQAGSVSFDLPASLTKLESLVIEAKGKGAGLVVFPEAFLSAYPRFLGFVIGTRTDENREWFNRYVNSAVKIPNGYLSVGIVERSHVGATLWCTNILLGPDGALLSRHRKLQPTAAERVVWHQGQGMTDGGREDNLPVVQTAMGRIGGLICWENYMPLARYLLYRKGVEIYLAPTADGRPTWTPTMQHIAQEGRCFVIGVNQYQSEEHFPANYPPTLKKAGAGTATTNTGNVQAEDKQGAHAASDGVVASPSHKQSEGVSTWCPGGTCIVGPLGQILAGPLWDREGVLYAAIDLDDLIGAKLDFDPVGHYSRDDLLVGLLSQGPS